MAQTRYTKAAQPAAPGWLAASPAIFVAFWSTGFIASRLIAHDAEPLSFLCVRFAIVAAILLAVSLVVKAHWPDRRSACHAFFAGALIHGGYLGGVFWSIYHGMPAGIAALIVGLQPIMTALLARPLLGEQVNRRQWAGLLLGITGIALVVWPKLEFSGTGITPSTILANVLATVAITYGSIHQKRFTANLDLRTGNTIQFLGGCAVTGLGAWLTESFIIMWTGEVVFAMVWLVVVLSIGAITMLFMMIRHGEVSRIAALSYLVPALTALIAWLMFAETLTATQFAGMAVCTAGVVIATRRAAMA